MSTDTDVNAIWSLALSRIEKSLTKPLYVTLVSATKPLSLSQGNYLVAVESDVVKQWLSSHCKELLEAEIKSISELVERVEFVIGSKGIFETPPLEISAPRQTLIPPQAFQPKSEPKSRTGMAPGSLYLSPRYNFEVFVIGHGNRFAHAAAQAVAEAPAAAYNPLFLYGGVGLGKTHLMQAIGNYALTINPSAKVLYITTEMFTNELINAIRDDKTVQFRNKYRTVDILLIDDIQFLAGKEATQEEFFHTFNSLYEASKQVVVSSDRPPKEIPTLEERLRSRFEWGLIADIQPPDFETRVAILRKKVEIGELNIPDEIINLIATKIVSNIRELEGALIRVVARAALDKVAISKELVESSLGFSLQGQAKPGITMALIKKATAEHFGVALEELDAKIRTKDVALARQVAMYLSRELTKSSLPKIGASFGGRDHTTVIHGCEKIREAYKKDQIIENSVKSIKAALKNAAT
ncbi:MAG: chromosomal replication initiator protein DnaA [Candidatus Margulisbacteria bacterium]|nr:chromosomal replication initiator protein DnaA [Candidatus Margulisiibacteriota bacterium]MBU1021981.1 chromosomal replication initiator protein DnaA [Candidatus Margulisiibacteriota bacterium]MBU1728959.1 chromosomal replication initiator protein DnaA [Candidatus Margulisiibacteriota bacterium]MBU1954765.1 chromosomal replication initiator protein DnaA [Candidatus Margulisiibacteriota bacterium]